MEYLLDEAKATDNRTTNNEYYHPYEQLANAIIIQAVNEIKTGMRRAWDVSKNIPKYRVMWDRSKALSQRKGYELNMNATREIEEMFASIEFFDSQWYSELTSVPAEAILTKVQMDCMYDADIARNALGILAVLRGGNYV